MINPHFNHNISGIDGTTELNGEKYFVLKSLQSPPNTDGEGNIKLIPYDVHTKSAGNLFELFQKNRSITNEVF